MLLEVVYILAPGSADSPLMAPDTNFTHRESATKDRAVNHMNEILKKIHFDCALMKARDIYRKCVLAYFVPKGTQVSSFFVLSLLKSLRGDYSFSRCVMTQGSNSLEMAPLNHIRAPYLL